MERRETRRSRVYPYLASVGLVCATTILGELLKRRLEPTNIGMFYLLIVVISAVRWGVGPAVLTSVLGTLCFDLFLIPPYLALTVVHIQYIFTLAGFLIVGLVVSTLASSMRKQVIQRQTEKLQAALLNSISHDLRTPLASITGSLSALLESDSTMDEDTRKELLETAFEESGRLNRLVGNLLDMTRMEGGALRIDRKPCELRDVLGSTLEQVKDKTKGREIRIDIARDFPEVPMDYSLMMKVFSNLIDNALKYSPEKTPIDVKARVVDGYALTEVRDRGSGIPEGDLSRIFEKFYRVKRPEKVEGTGLGLSICRGIVEAHNGKITARNNPDGGASFLVTLPLN